MPESDEYRDLCANLRDYAFEHSPQFKDGTLPSVSYERDFIQPNIPFGIRRIIHDLYIAPPAVARLGLQAIREIDNEYCWYSYSLEAQAIRPISALPDYLEIALPDPTRDRIVRTLGRKSARVLLTHASEYYISDENPESVDAGEYINVSIGNEIVYDFSSSQILFAKDRDNGSPFNQRTKVGDEEIILPSQINHERIDDIATRAVDYMIFNKLIRHHTEWLPSSIVPHTTAFNRLKEIFYQLRGN